MNQRKVELERRERMNCSPGYFRPGKGFTSRTVVLCGFLFLTFTAYVACSNPSPTLQSTASPVVATAPELTTPALTAVTPTPSLTPTSQQTFTPDAGPVSPAPTATAKSSAGALVPAPEPTSAPIARMPVIPATTPPPDASAHPRARRCPGTGRDGRSTRVIHCRQRSIGNALRCHRRAQLG